jgi:hypothetical protein
MPELVLMKHFAPAWGGHADGSLVVRAPEYDDEGSYAYEELATRREGDGRHRICCIPAYAREIFPDDVIGIDPQGNPRMLSRGSWWSLRIWDEKGAMTSAYLEGLQKRGLLVEQLSQSLFAIACQGEPLADTLAGELEGLSRSLGIEFETGWS